MYTEFDAEYALLSSMPYYYVFYSNYVNILLLSIIYVLYTIIPRSL